VTTPPRRNMQGRGDFLKPVPTSGWHPKTQRRRSGESFSPSCATWPAPGSPAIRSAARAEDIAASRGRSPRCPCLAISDVRARTVGAGPALVPPAGDT